MKWDRALEASMAMDDATWARHANPWSLYTRVPILPLMVFAIWSRIWIGWWCLFPLAALLVWTFINPRAFPRPGTIDTWAAKVTFGERLWLAAPRKPDPKAPCLVGACALVGLRLEHHPDDLGTLCAGALGSRAWLRVGCPVQTLVLRPHGVAL